MTKQEFMYIVGINDEKELGNIMLLANEVPPDNGDWTELMKKWYTEVCKSQIEYMHKYHEVYCIIKSLKGDIK